MDCWIKFTWEFASKYDILIDEAAMRNLILRRRYDTYLMESIVNLHCYSNSELQYINKCRIFLQVTTLSDITTTCGRVFSHSAYHCTFDSTIPHHYDWPIQPRPYGYTRMLWKQATKRAFPRQGFVLTQPLGSWTDDSRDQWIWFHQPSTGRLYIRCQGRWRMYMHTSRTGLIG